MTDDEPVLIRKPENTRMVDDPKDARYVVVETGEEKEYLEHLREKGKYSVTGLRSKLVGMREYKEWSDSQ